MTLITFILPTFAWAQTDTSQNTDILCNSEIIRNQDFCVLDDDCSVICRSSCPIDLCTHYGWIGRIGLFCFLDLILRGQLIDVAGRKHCCNNSSCRAGSWGCAINLSWLSRRRVPLLDKVEGIPGVRAVEAIDPHIPYTVCAHIGLPPYVSAARVDHHMRLTEGGSVAPHDEVAPEQRGAPEVGSESEVVVVGVVVERVHAHVIVVGRAIEGDGATNVVVDHHPVSREQRQSTCGRIGRSVLGSAGDHRRHRIIDFRRAGYSDGRRRYNCTVMILGACSVFGGYSCRTGEPGGYCSDDEHH